MTADGMSGKTSRSLSKLLKCSVPVLSPWTHDSALTIPVSAHVQNADKACISIHF